MPNPSKENMHCFRMRWNLQSAHTGPLILNISLTINIAGIDVKQSQSETDEREEKGRREENVGGKERGLGTDNVDAKQYN